VIKYTTLSFLAWGFCFLERPLILMMIMIGYDFFYQRQFSMASLIGRFLTFGTFHRYTIG